MTSCSGSRTETGHRRVLVTGGTGAVGYAMVAAFAAAGHQVSFQYHRNHSMAERIESEFSVSAINLDFSTGFTLDDLDFDILINNAGINLSDLDTHLIDVPTWSETLNVNLTAPFLLIRSILPPMMRKGWGRILNISSIYGLRGGARRAAYVASKHGLSGLTKAVASEYGRYGITCNEICPGALDSRLVRSIAANRARLAGQGFDEVLEEYRNQNPTGRLATPEEVAALAVFLCTTSADFINGASIPIDGGLIA